MTDVTYLFMSATSGQSCVSSVSTCVRAGHPADMDIFSEQTNVSNRLSNCHRSHLTTSLLFLFRLDFSLQFIPNITTHPKHSLSICVNKYKCFTHYYTAIWHSLRPYTHAALNCGEARMLTGSLQQRHANIWPILSCISYRLSLLASNCQ